MILSYEKLISSMIPKSASSLVESGTWKDTAFWVGAGLAFVVILVFIYWERENLIYPLFRKQVKEATDLPDTIDRSQSYRDKFEWF